MRHPFDGINPKDRMLPSRFEQARTSVAGAAPEAEDARERMEIRHTSFLLKMVCYYKMQRTRGSGVEPSAQNFLT